MHWSDLAWPLLVLLASGCIDPTDTTIQASGSVEGVIWSGARELPDALVWIDESHWARTDEVGFFRIQGLEGPVDLHIMALDHLPRTVLAWNDSLASFGLGQTASVAPSGAVEGVVRLPEPFEERVDVHMHVGGGRSSLRFEPGEVEASFSHAAGAGLTAAYAYTRGELMMEWFALERGHFVPDEGTLEIDLTLSPSPLEEATGTGPVPPEWAESLAVSATAALGAEGSAFVSGSGVVDDTGSWALPLVSIPTAEAYRFSARAWSEDGASLTLYHPDVATLDGAVAFPESFPEPPGLSPDWARLAFDWAFVQPTTYGRLRLQQETEEGWESVWTAEGQAGRFEVPQLPAELADLSPIDPSRPLRARVELYAVPAFDPVHNWNFDTLESRYTGAWREQLSE